MAVYKKGATITFPAGYPTDARPFTSWATVLTFKLTQEPGESGGLLKPVL